MDKSNNLLITGPEPYQKVDGCFTIRGSVPLRLLGRVEGASSYRMLFDLLNAHGTTIYGTSVDISLPAITGDPGQVIDFSFPVEIRNPEDNQWIVSSEGRMAVLLSLSGYSQDEEPNEFFLPIVFNIPNPTQGFSEIIIRKHESIEQRVKQYRIDSRKYTEELSRIQRRRNDFFESSKQTSSGTYRELTGELVRGLLDAIDSSGYDEEIRALQELYRESLEWSGPLAAGEVGRLDGFIFRVYSNDHDSHFHAIHRDKEIDARFSFPGIQLMSYKGRSNEISSKVIKNIQQYFKDPDNLKRLESELSKQIRS